MTWQLVTSGRNRFVLLTSRYAIKFPSLRSWRDFLFGLLNNIHEAQVSAFHSARCPVLRASPLGLYLVMPRLEVMTPEEFSLFKLPEGTLAEPKPCSWGWWYGRPVAIDYGWPGAPR